MNDLTWTLVRSLDWAGTKRLPPVALQGVSLDEVLIDDPRGDLTPTEMLNHKLLHLLGAAHSSASFSRRGVRQ